MNIEQIIQNAFPESSVLNTVNDDYISGHQNLMEIPEEIELLAYVPAYMLWCVRNANNYDQLVTDYTINSIAEYGRAKDRTNNYLNFKYRCSAEQKNAVLAFLQWCLEHIEFVNEQQIARAIKHWGLGAV